MPLASTTITGFAWVIAILVVATFAYSSFHKANQKIKGRNRCDACGTRLKYVRGAYMPVCRKCGTRQSWAP